MAAIREKLMKSLSNFGNSSSRADDDSASSSRTSSASAEVVSKPAPKRKTQRKPEQVNDKPARSTKRKHQEVVEEEEEEEVAIPAPEEFTDEEYEDAQSVVSGVTRAVFEEEQDLDNVASATKNSYLYIGTMAPPLSKDAPVHRLTLNNEFGYQNLDANALTSITDLAHVTENTSKVLNHFLVNYAIAVVESLPDTFVTKNEFDSQEKKKLNDENYEYAIMKATIAKYPGHTGRHFTGSDPSNHVESLLNHWKKEKLFDFHVELLKGTFVPVKLLVDMVGNVVEFYRMQETLGGFHPELTKAILMTCNAIENRFVFEEKKPAGEGNADDDTEDESSLAPPKNMNSMVSTVVRMIFEAYFDKVKTILNKSFGFLQTETSKKYSDAVKALNNTAVTDGKKKGVIAEKGKTRNEKELSSVMNSLANKYADTLRPSFVDDGSRVVNALSPHVTPETMRSVGLVSATAKTEDLKVYSEYIKTPAFKNVLVDFYPSASVDIWTILFMSCDWRIINQTFVDAVLSAHEISSINTVKVKRPRTAEPLSKEERNEQMKKQREKRQKIDEERKKVLLDAIRGYVDNMAHSSATDFDKYLVNLAVQAAITHIRNKERAFVTKLSPEWKPISRSRKQE